MEINSLRDATYTYEDYYKDLAKIGITQRQGELFKEAKRGLQNLKNIQRVSGGFWKTLDDDKLKKIYMFANKVNDSAINDDTDNDYAEASSEEVAKKGIIAELDTTTEYDGLILQLKELYNKTQDEKYLTAANAIEDINREEYAHAGEFSQILANLNPDISADVQEGMQEVRNEEIGDACSVKDSLGEGKCTPICSNYINSVNNLIISYNRDTDKDSPTSKRILKRQIEYINEQISETEFQIKKFDEYWPKHKAEMLDNIQKAKAQLTNFIRQNNIKDTNTIEDDCSVEKDIEINDSKDFIISDLPYKTQNYIVAEGVFDGEYRRIWMIIRKDKYHNEKRYKGSGTVEFNFVEAKKTADNFEIIDKLDKKYGKVEAHKRWIAGEKDASINDLNYAEKSLKEPTQPLKDSLPSIEEVKAVLKKTMFNDPRTAVKYVGKISTGGKEKDKFIFGIPGGNTQYAIYFVNGKYDGITRINASSNIKLDSAPELNEENDESVAEKERKAQEWVDYDIKHYGKVSEETKNIIKKMGLDFDKWDNQVYDSEEYSSGAGYQEADVNEPVDPLCDGVLEGFDKFLSSGLDLTKGAASKLDCASVKDESTTSSDANNSGRVVIGNKYYWPEKYADRTLSVVKVGSEGIELELNRTTKISMPLEKFYSLLDEGKVKAISSVNIDSYDKVETTRKYKMNIGDKTYVVKANSKDAAIKKLNKIIKKK